ncbi:hypothetical protein GIB67_018757 [Kingdonia uniflora]|uniref:Glyceraldehyde 3-phosphate dehydrogenase NAD(P) binding domain-containing protein n=1 Tax=Kingdonia uniflora TaxID=39325 RepID=A0A7J7LSK6_9MAGN|nr:hypothetical protein GIB67_018757 [Kingdonia uniflora]
MVQATDLARDLSHQSLRAASSWEAWTGTPQQDSSFHSGSLEVLLYESGDPTYSSETVYGCYPLKSQSVSSKEEESEASSPVVENKFSTTVTYMINMNKSKIGSSCNEVCSTQAELSLESMVNSVLNDRHVYDKHSPQISTLSFFASPLYIATLVAIAATITRRFSRKIYAPRRLPFLVGAVLNGVAVNVVMLYVGLIFLGIGVGFANQFVPLHLSEIAPCKHRGRLNVFFQLMITIGIHVANLVNYVSDKIKAGSGWGWRWRLSLALAAVPALIVCVGAQFLPDTPNCLIDREKPEEAKAMLKRIRGTDDVDKEYNDLVLASKASKFMFIQVDVLLTPLTHLPLQASHLLKYDSMLGTFKVDVKIVDNETISVDGKPIKVVSSRDPLKLPWAEMGINIVIELHGTGVLVDGPGAGKHIQAGAKKVIITAPAKGADIPANVIGVNEKDYEHDLADIMRYQCFLHHNCLAPFAKVLDEEFGIVRGTMTTAHSYTGDQRLLGTSHRDLRRARAAALNIVPTSTNAAKAVSLVLPPTKGEA